MHLRMVPLLLFAAITLVGCAEEVRTASAVPTPSAGDGGGGSGAGGSGGRAPVPPHEGQAFALDGDGSAVNLSLDDDGSVRWLITGCDFWGGGVARWSMVDGMIELTPEEGEAIFAWMNEISFYVEVTRVSLDPDTLVASVVRQGGETYEQQWRQGFVCLDCTDWTKEYGCTAFPFEAFWELMEEE